MEKMHIFVSGKVQGVFFRAHVKKWAEELKLKGWVKNLENGKVECVAQGIEKNLKKFVQKIEKGSPASKVENVVTEFEELEHFKDFEIKY